MGRPPKPWYRTSRDWWMVEIDDHQVKLCRGKENRADAQRRFHQLMAERASNPPVDGDHPTVGSLFDAFLEHSVRRNRTGTFEWRLAYLQDFSDIWPG